MRANSVNMARTSRQGFTLFELVLVLFIFAIIASVAAPRYASAISRFQVDTVARRLVRDLTTARERARSQGANQSVTFTVASDAYTVVGLTGLDGSANYTVSVSGKPYNASIVSANFGGQTSVLFDGYGVPTSGGTVVLSSGGYTKTVTVNAQTGKAAHQ